MRANKPEFSKRLRLLDPCFRDSMCIMDNRKRACGMVPRLGPAGFSLVMVCKGTGCTPASKEQERNALVRVSKLSKIIIIVISEKTPLTELFEAGTGLQQDVTNIMNGPGIQLAEGNLQQHAVEGRDQIHILQAVRQRLSDNES